MTERGDVNANEATSKDDKHRIPEHKCERERNRPTGDTERRHRRNSTYDIDKQASGHR